jgi:hypothetical protein
VKTFSTHCPKDNESRASRFRKETKGLYYHINLNWHSILLPSPLLMNNLSKVMLSVDRRDSIVLRHEEAVDLIRSSIIECTLLPPPAQWNGHIARTCLNGQLVLVCLVSQSSIDTVHNDNMLCQLVSYSARGNDNPLNAPNTGFLMIWNLSTLRLTTNDIHD